MTGFQSTARTVFLVSGIAVALSNAPGNCEPAEDAVRKLIEDLGSEDPATRDAASEKLVESGIAVLPLLESALEAGTNVDAETTARLQECIAKIRSAERRRQLWKRPPGDDIADWVKKHPCGCATPTPHETEEIDNERLKRWFPECRFFLVFTACCEGHRAVRERLVVCREPDGVERTGGDAGFRALKDHCRAARSAPEVREAADLVFALNRMPVHVDGLPGAYEPKIRVTETNEGTVWEYGVTRISFDAEGRLKDIVIGGKK